MDMYNYEFKEDKDFELLKTTLPHLITSGYTVEQTDVKDPIDAVVTLSDGRKIGIEIKVHTHFCRTREEPRILIKVNKVNKAVKHMEDCGFAAVLYFAYVEEDKNLYIYNMERLEGEETFIRHQRQRENEPDSRVLPYLTYFLKPHNSIKTHNYDGLYK